MNIELILFVVTVVLGGFSWFFKRELTYNDRRVEKLETEISLIKSLYLPKDDFRDFKAELKSMFEDIKQDIHSIRNSMKNG